MFTWHTLFPAYPERLAAMSENVPFALEEADTLTCTPPILTGPMGPALDPYQRDTSHA